MTEPDQPAERTAKPAGLGQAISDQFSLQATIGGPLGLIESVLPMTLFSVVYGLGAEMVASLAAAAVPSVGFAIWRLIARQPLTQAISGALGIGIGAVIALRTGRAADFVLPSLIKNAAWGVGYAISILVRWPLVGVLLGFMLGEQLHWRSVPARARAYSRASWVWVGMFAVRLAVQIPLWMAGAAAALGLVNVVLGLPLFGLTIWLTWVIVQRVPVAHAPGHEHHERAPAHTSHPVDEAGLAVPD
ncbi:MAG TPA: DUF3159 domain-containing protein [Kineosporiaceae bacterium]|jgi:hypothetical protein|nr:DUF3159 domain-containing protein [Kineosporiaceae bacterium]